MTKVIARTDLRIQYRSGIVQPVHIEIDEPELDGDGAWRCVVRLTGLQDGFSPIYGEDSLQPLTLALSFARRLLRAELQRGSRLIGPNHDDEFPLDAYFPPDDGGGRAI